MKTHNYCFIFILFLFSSLNIQAQAYIEMGVGASYCSSSLVCSPTDGCLEVSVTNLSSPSLSYPFTGTVYLKKKISTFVFQTVGQQDASGTYSHETFTFDDIDASGQYVAYVSLTHAPLSGQQFDVKEKYSVYWSTDYYNYRNQYPKTITVNTAATADFLINGNTVSESTVNPFCPNESLTMNGSISTGSSTSGNNYEHRFYYRFANTSGGATSGRNYSNGTTWLNGKPSSSINLKSTFPQLNTPGNYRIGLEVRNDCNSIYDERSIWMEITSDDFNIMGSEQGNPDPIALTIGGTCNAISNIVCGLFQTSYTFEGTNNNNFPIDQYKFTVTKYNNCNDVNPPDYESDWIDLNNPFIDEFIFNVGSSILTDGGTGTQANQFTEENKIYNIILEIDAGDCSIEKDFWIDNSGICKRANEASTDLIYGLNAYPNPFENQVNIRFFSNEHLNDLSLTIYDATGHIVKQIADNDFRFKGLQSLSLNLENFNSGLYYYELLTAEQSWKGKLVKT
ncbi:MAG: T9SS type A sorting domain-containing protein [Chitinophagales bacterium]